MLKAVLAGATALTILGSGLALAQQTSPATEAPRMRRNADDAAAMTDARIAALRAGLKLTADQEKNWPPVEAAIRDFGKQRSDRMTERAEAREKARAGGERRARPDMLERMRSNADSMSERAASMKKLADAVEPLYKTLDDGQKRRLGALMRMGADGPRVRIWHGRGNGPGGR